MTITITAASIAWLLIPVIAGTTLTLIIALWITKPLRHCTHDVTLVSSNYYQQPKTMTNGKVSYSE